MRAAFACVASFLSALTGSAATPDFRVPPAPFQVKPGDLHAFYGQVKEVDRAARTVTIGMPMRFTFRVPAETQISIRRRGATAFDAIKPGAGAQIVARRGTNTWTATKITLEQGATFPEEMSVTTTAGKTLTGIVAAELVVYEPPRELINRNIDFGHRDGFFLLSVQPDGAVAKVRTIKSLGRTELDAHAIRRLKAIKFRPGSVTEARVPVSVSSFRR